jgi:hypothetical protein
MRKIPDMFVGRWRILRSHVWGQSALDLVTAACIEVEADRTGRLQFIGIDADADFRVESRNGRSILEFSWEGSEEGDRTCGRGWATLEGAELHGRLYVHRGEESAFVARPEAEE